MQLYQKLSTVSVTKKGQVTIPHNLRRKYGKKAGDEVVFEDARESIRIRPAITLESVYGSVKPLTKKISFEKMKQIALEEKLNGVR